MAKKKLSPQKAADRRLCPVQVAGIMQMRVNQVAAAMCAAGADQTLTPGQVRAWRQNPATAPEWFTGLLAEQAVREAERASRSEREDLERQHRLVIAEDKVTRRLLAGARNFRNPDQELIASDMAFRASKELVRASGGKCGEIDPECLTDLDRAALRWVGVDPLNHSTWVVHSGDCRNTGGAR